MSSTGVFGLQFPYRELIRETEALRRIATDVLVSDGPLRDFARELEQIGESSAERDRWIELQPLRTQPTSDYEPASRSGGQKVYALVRGIWQVHPVGRKRPGRRIAFVGSASTKVELWPAECLYGEEAHKPSRLAMWRIELGTHDSPGRYLSPRDSPGCYFHFQILGDDSDPPFPKNIPVPRLPSPFVTPMAAVEFVLGELFQDDWQQRTGGGRNHHNEWRAIQRERWLGLIRWQKKYLGDDRASPWMNLKAAKPPDRLFAKS